jgi:glycosyltransferase involved in cell wall biosynthesis
MIITKVSVIMAVYNSEKFLSEAIESILNQTFKDFEFIIIDDCSSDNSLDIIKNYAKQDKRIILIENKKNIGLTKSLNKGLKIAKGKYIARIDADDIALSERLEKQYNFLEKNPGIFLLGTGAYNIDENGNVKSIKKPLTNSDLIKKTLYYKNCIYHPTITFSNEGFLYREKFYYSQDYDFYLRMISEAKKLTNTPNLLIKYRMAPEAVSFSQRAKQRLFAEKAKEFYRQRLKYGKDEYDKFNPNEVLDIDVEKSVKKIVLESEIKASFKLNDFKRVKKFCRKYFKNYGVLNKIIIYFLLSFTGRKFINIIRRLIFH